MKIILKTVVKRKKHKKEAQEQIKGLTCSVIEKKNGKLQTSGDMGLIVSISSIINGMKE